jgi:quercetin dioxygenase-like cupin family protein
MSLPPGLLARRTGVADPPRQLWHLGGLLSIRSTAGDTEGAVGVVEEHAVRGYGTPPHVHSREDETLVVLDGELEYLVDGVAGTVSTGSSVFLPRNRSHRFEVISDEAHFLVIITPGGFEEFFWHVSPPATETRVPREEEARTDLATIVGEANALGATVFCDDRASRRRHLDVIATSTDAHEIASAYRYLAELVAGATPTPQDVLPALLDVASRRLQGQHIHARALILLGILTESSAERVSAGIPNILHGLGTKLPAFVGVAMAYLCAHFPEHADAVRDRLRPLGLPDEDWQRLERCLCGFSAEHAAERIGRSWPTPAVWGLDEDDAERDRHWRRDTNWAPDLVRAIWDAETTALLAFMGAKADHDVERHTHA